MGTRSAVFTNKNHLQAFIGCSKNNREMQTVECLVSMAPFVMNCLSYLE